MMLKSTLTCGPHYDNLNSVDRLTRSFLEARDDLLRFLKRRGRRRQQGTAEDIVQTVWLKHRERGDSQSWQEPRAVLFTTAANLQTDAHRREVSAEKVFSSEAADPEAPCPHSDPETQADAAGRLERLAAALEQLPPQCREVFLLNRLEELTHVEIAARLGISTKTVQRHIERALRLCLQVLE
jgi:RNA polymerase sigma factor (sigma-70 family)